MQEEKLADFIPWMREYYRAYLDGTCTYTEFNTLLWLHFIADAEGVVHAKSYTWLSETLPVNVKGNTVGKVLKSLRNHKWIYFGDQQGRRRGFRIYLMNRKLKNDKIREYDSFIKREESISEDISRSQVSEEVVKSNHKFDIPKNIVNKGKNDNGGFKQITCSYNDNKNENYKKYDRSVKKVKVSDFEPKDHVDEKLYQIARSVDEEYMGFVFSIYSKYKEDGIRVMDRVACDLIDRPNVKDKPRYFNKEVNRLLSSENSIN